MGVEVLASRKRIEGEGRERDGEGKRVCGYQGLGSRCGALNLGIGFGLVVLLKIGREDCCSGAGKGIGSELVRF